MYLRDPNAYTPLIEPQTIRGQKVTSLILGRDAIKNQEQIAQFSERDAQVIQICYISRIVILRQIIDIFFLFLYVSR